MPLSEIIKQQTKDGETVVSFLQNVMKGDLEGFKEGHRIRAAELLTRFGHEEARAYIREYSQPASPDDDPATRSRDTRFDRALTKAIKEDTGDGRYVSRFLLNLMDGDLRSFNKGHRIRAATELMVRLEGIVIGYTSTRNSPKRPKAPITRPTPVRAKNTAAPVAPVPAPGVTANSAAPAPGSVATIDADDSVGTQTESADQHSDPDDGGWARLEEVLAPIFERDRLKKEARRAAGELPDPEEPVHKPDYSMWEDIHYDPKDIEPYVEEITARIKRELPLKEARRKQVREERKPSAPRRMKKNAKPKKPRPPKRLRNRPNPKTPAHPHPTSTSCSRSSSDPNPTSSTRTADIRSATSTSTTPKTTTDRRAPPRTNPRSPTPKTPQTPPTRGPPSLFTIPNSQSKHAHAKPSLLTAPETTTGSAGILPAWGWGWGEERGKRREKIDGCRLEGGHLGGVTAAKTTTGSAGILPAWGWGWGEERGKRREKIDGCRLEGGHLGVVTAAKTTTGSAGILPPWGWGWGEERGTRREKRDGCGLEGAHLGGVTAAETTTGSAGILPAWGWGWGEERGKRREKIDGCRLEGGHLGVVTAAETTTGSAGILPAWGWGCVRREERGGRK